MFTPSQRVFAGIVLALSNFMVVLDLTIANVSVPHIAGNLGVSLDQGTWIITTYAVAEAICVPLTGWLAQRFGAVRSFIFSLFGFGLFSLLCGMSPSLQMLVLCRLGQGFCGGPLMPMSQTLMTRVFPPEQQGKAMGIWAMTTLLGPAAGPIIGGAISDGLNWHWIFLINVPIALACAFVAMVILPKVETQTRKVPIDKVGLGLLVFWIGALQIMLDTGRDHDWFGDWRIVMLAVMAGVGFLAFLIWELTEEHPVVDLRVFRHRGFTFSVITLALCFGAYFASIVVIPQWLQTSLGYTATMAGLTTAFTAMAAFTTSMLAVKLMGRVDLRVLISLAVAWLGIMSVVRAHWTSDIDFWDLSWPQLLQGFAMSFFMIPLTNMSLNSVDPDEVASAAGLQNFLRTMAIAISTSLALTIWGNAQRVSHSELAGKVQIDNTMTSLTGTGYSHDQALQIVNGIIDKESITLAVDQTFWITSVVLFLAAAMIWLTPGTKHLKSVGGPVE